MVKQKALNAVAKGAGWAAIGMFVSKILTYFFRAAVARFLDPSAYGQFSLGLSVLIILNSVSFIAMGVAAKKYIPEYLSRNDIGSVKGVIYSSISITLPLSLLATAVMFFSAGFLSHEVFNTEDPEQLKHIIQVLAFVIPLSNLMDLFAAVTVAYKKIRYEVISEMLFRNVVQLLVTVGLLLLGFNIIAAAYGWLIAVFLSTVLIALIIEFKLGPIVRDEVKPKMMQRKLFKFSAPLVLGTVIGSILGNVDTVMLGYFLTDSQVGIYNVAFPIAGLIMLPYKSISRLALPSVSEMKEKDEKEIPAIVKTMTRWSIAVSFPAFALVALFSEQTIRLLFGSQYVAGATALVILAFGKFMNSFTGPLGSIINTYEENQIIFKNSFAKFVINVGLNLALIPVLGIVGAAIATAGTTTFMNLLVAAEVYHIKKIHPFSLDGFKPIMSSFTGISVVYLLMHLVFEQVPVWALVPGGLVFGIIYFVVLIGMKGIKPEDRDIIVGIGRRMNKEKEAEKLADIMIRD